MTSDKDLRAKVSPLSSSSGVSLRPHCDIKAKNNAGLRKPGRNEFDNRPDGQRAVAPNFPLNKLLDLPSFGIIFSSTF